MVNHRKVKQLIAEKRKTVTDKQFFTSRILSGHFAEIAAAQTRRYGHNRRVKVQIVWEPKNGSLASTDNLLVNINAGNKMVTKRRGREKRYNLICGLFAHELGHILYTDFLAMQTHDNKLRARLWYPEKPLLRNADERRNEADLWDFCGKNLKHIQVLCNVAHRLFNILEDGYISNKMVTRYPGVLGQNLYAWIRYQFREAPTLTQMIEAEDTGKSHIWTSITGLILDYMLWGDLKYGDEPMSDERVQVVFSLLPELDRALTHPSTKERLNVVNTILVCCWPYVKSFIEFCMEQAEQPDAGDAADISAGMMPSASEEGTGGTTPVPEVPDAEEPKLSNPGKRAKTAKAAKTSPVGAGEDDSVTMPGDPAKGEPTDGELAADGEPAGMPEPDHQPDKDAADGRIPLMETDALSEPVGGTTDRDDDYTGAGYDRAAKDIERLLDQVSEENVMEELEEALADELNTQANNLRYGNVHAGVSFIVHRMRTVDDGLKEQYQSIAGPLLQISKQLQRSIAQQLKDRRLGGKQTNLLMGRRLYAHALPRNDGHVFYKNRLPTEPPRLAVGLLIDQSLSMNENDRITYARMAAIILYDFCRALGIPVMVYGHSTHYNGVDLYSYAEFDAYGNDDRYRLMDISAHSCNRDGAALRYVAEQLSRRPEEVKMLMLVSDGQPFDDDYMGTAAEEDLRGIQSEYQRKGLLFIAAAIGDDRENLQRIYGESYLDISDLSQLPIKLTQVVKRHIQV